MVIASTPYPSPPGLAEPSVRRQIVSLILLTCAFAFPLWLMPFDFWDGRAVDYGMAMGDLSGLKLWFFENGVHLSYWVDFIVYHIGVLTGGAYRLVFKLMFMLAICGLTMETFLYTRKTLGLSDRDAFFSAILCALFPTWHLLVMSNSLLYSQCIWWVLWGYRLVGSTRILVQSIGLVLITLSFELNSLFAVLVGLCLADYLLLYLRERRLAWDVTSQRFLLIVYACVCFVLLKHYFPPYGAYEGYNHLVITDGVLPGVFKIIVRCAVYAGLFAIYLLPALLGIAVALRWAFGSWRAAKEACQALLGRHHAALILVPLLLCVTGFAPYVMADKSAKFFDLSDWSLRNAFPLATPISLLIAGLCRCADHVLERAASKRHLTKRHLMSVVRWGCALAFAGLLYMGYSQKVQRAAFESHVIDALHRMSPPQDGTVWMYYEDLHGVTERSYEANWLLWKAYGRVGWISAFTDAPITPADSVFAIQKTMLSDMLEKPIKDGRIDIVRERFFRGDVANRLEGILPEQTQFPCHTNIRIEGAYYSVTDSWLWILGLKDVPGLKARITQTGCKIR